MQIAAPSCTLHLHLPEVRTRADANAQEIGFHLLSKVPVS
jgi:hypothetical protein